MNYASFIGKTLGRLTVVKLTKLNNKPAYECKCLCGNTKIVLASTFTRKTKPTRSCGCLRIKSILGNTYGRLTVVKELPIENNEKRRCLCDCSCGTKNYNISVSSLVTGNSFSCGCILKEKRDKVQPGMVFGRLTVIKYHKLKKLPKSTWQCVCFCGNKVETNASKLLTGSTKSCGCLKQDFLIKHGHTLNKTYTKTYSSWKAMKSRCYNINNEYYKYYGNKGVTVCQRWLNSFENFLADMGERPKRKTIDRIDPFGNYEPNNCRWAGKYTQAGNKRKPPVKIVYKGKLTKLSTACRKEKFSYNKAANRKILGWPDKKLFI